MPVTSVRIDTFRSEHATRFGELNRAWLDDHNLYEHTEEEQLTDPEAYFIGGGGQIFVALHNEEVIGTCAVMPDGPGELELAKLTVAPEFRGQGIARRLVERCIEYGREHGVTRLILVSNSRLQAALRLYESMGFQHCPLPAAVKYEIADVCMTLTLDPTP